VIFATFHPGKVELENQTISAPHKKEIALPPFSKGTKGIPLLLKQQY